MTQAQNADKKPSFLKKTKRELTKSLFFFTAGSLTTAALMLNNKRKQKQRKRLEKALEEKEKDND